METPVSTESSTPSGEKGDVSVMVAGEAGVGKTSFINALLGLTDGEHRETVKPQMCTKGPVLQMQPAHPNFFLWELHVDNKDPTSHPENWMAEADILVLITASHFCEWHTAQAKRVQELSKIVYFVRSKVDLDLHTVKRKMKANYEEQKILQVMKSIEMDFLQSQGLQNSQIFLVSNYEPYKLDCPLLQQILKEDVRTYERSHKASNQEYYIIDVKEIEEIRAAYESGGVPAVVARIQHSLDIILNTKLDIAITGESGAGKSSFVNALLGLKDDDPGAAEVGVVECTRVPQEYIHSKYSNVKIWDLPGIGTPMFKAVDYLERVNFHIYDFFILLASERFKENHIKLAKDIGKQGKNFYFVRTKVDNDVFSMKRGRRQPVDEEAILETIRENCQKNLEQEGLENVKVFLLSSHELEKYDFQKFQETMEQELPGHKKRAFLLSLPNLSENIIQKKKQLLGQEIFKLAMISCLVAAVPIPGIAFVCDISMLLARLSTYRKDFDLDEESLAKLSEKSGKPVEVLKSVIQSPLGKAINQDLVVHMLSKATGTGLVVANLFFHRIPVFGSVASGGIAFRATYAMLTQALEDLASDSQRVLVKAFEAEV
uniref:Interferon-inducible GTPase 5-like n=1 Tax=Geotrypetes seraphini TaxID=260995 RepID=A0A6P8SKN9_GEOSA|nr:interferon-inducible GTPase 5-like [Geotrypetes seraphini]XP_033819425.1 interferon-inducible GTPase 5-like [Geotrypetes seraphini]XP_033819426.1 interferon-inducible GTPase 5-like [Geotrypetes seraphini]